MTGENDFPKYKITKEALKLFIDSLMDDFVIVGPVNERGHTFFRRVQSAAVLTLDYTNTMLPPSKVLFYRPIEKLLTFDIDDMIHLHEIPPEDEKVLALGVHPCDINAILYLDKVFKSDPYYMKRRENTTLVALNCTTVDEFCFCSSLGTGPHLETDYGYDLLLTDIGEYYLVEPRTPRGQKLFGGVRKAGLEELHVRDEQKKALLAKIKKHIDMNDLDGIFLENVEHSVWAEVADRRCLSCTNCVMVCPTCFCYDLVDETDMSMKMVTRHRRWDACQDLHFAKFHGGNFRHVRAARLRQFVTHKLDYTSQFGTPGTVGCGRCIRWCPTGIDLTEIAKEIQRNPVR
jgi:sulfhydrogenase subunit beta (sulfur reductase)